MKYNNIRKYFKELFRGEFYLFYRIYYTEILSTKMSVRLFGVDSIF